LARGTFNSHPHVMGSMNEFLTRIQQADIQKKYQLLSISLSFKPLNLFIIFA